MLIDGIKVGSATLGQTAFQDIPIEQIERVEIVRGPRSSLYGSEAIGGVIQIFTRRGDGPVTPHFSIGGGRYDTYNASAGVSGSSGRGWFSLNASGTDTKGFNACEGKPGVGGCLTIEPDKDGYRNYSGSLRAGYRFDNGFEMDFNVLHADGDNEFDGDFQNESETVQQVFGGTMRYSPVELWDVTLKVGRSRDESDNFKDGEFFSRFDTERDTLSLQNDLAIADDQLVTLGFDYQDDHVDSKDIDRKEIFVVDSRDNKGVFAQYQGMFDAQDLVLNLRHDDNEQFGEETTGGAAWGYAFINGLQLTISYGTAFKAPTFNELYFPDFGNPDLQPEESQSFEVGLSSAAGWGEWSLNIFETRVDDLITYDAAIQAAVNIGEARIRGLEAAVGANLYAWDLTASLTLLDPEERTSGPNRGNILPRRAQQTLRLDTDRNFAKFNLGATLVAAGSRYDDLANTRELSGYATLDLRAEYSLTKAWRLQARIENLLDKEYETAEFYNQPGSSLYLTLRYQP